MVSSALEVGLTKGKKKKKDLLPRALQICPEQGNLCLEVKELQEPVVLPHQRCFHLRFQGVSNKSDGLSGFTILPI